jgi:hypothetical protein
METNAKDRQPRKKFLAAIWQSMTKSGGCCGSGGNCCGSSQPNSGKEKAKDTLKAAGHNES